MKKIILSVLVLVGAPYLALAENGYVVSNDVSAFTLLGKFAAFLDMAVPVLITIAVVYFIWGIIQFMIASDEEAKKLGRVKIINGLIGLFIIVAFWGVINFVQNTLGVGNKTNQNIIPITGTNGQG